MATGALIGGTLVGIIEDASSPDVGRVPAGYRVTRSYSLLKSQVTTIVSAVSFGTVDSVYLSSMLQEVTARPVSGRVSNVKFMFAPNEPAEETPPIGTVIKEIDANPIQIPIEQHPDWTASLKALRIEAGNLEGVTGFLSPQPIYTRTEILSSFTFSEANAIDNVGVIDDTPEGLDTPTAGKWLKTGLRVRTIGDLFEQFEQWQYASAGWDANIYATIA